MAVNLIDMLFLENMVREMLEDHRSIVLARRYHEGDQDVFLDERLLEFLGLHDDNPFHLNICKTVVNALKDELNVIGFDTTETADQDRKKAQAEWAWLVWQNNRMDAKQGDVHETALRDRETFIIVDWDAENSRPRFTHQLRFTDTDVQGGTGEGCWIVYENDDMNQPPRAAVKQWVETIFLVDGTASFRARRTVYYPERIEKWFYDYGWHELIEEGAEWPLPWVTRDNKPLGIPVIHFRNSNLRPEAWDAIPMQDAVNKQIVDILATSDMSAFPMLVALGFFPTTDGQAVKEDGSNLLGIKPGTWIGSNKEKDKASVEKISGTDVTPMINTLKDLIVLTAQITDTPVSRFVSSGQVAGSETLKEQEKPLKKKAKNRRVLIGNSWEDCMIMARRLDNFFGGASLSEDVRFSALWEYSESLDELKEYQELGVPEESLWRRIGFSESEITAMKDTEEHKLKMAKLLWEAAGAAVTAGNSLENFLRDMGWTDEQLKDLGTQKLAAIKLKQEDAVPPTSQ